jgi:tripartite-type tricarboxylate transporter receptor subunit TctC
MTTSRILSFAALGAFALGGAQAASAADLNAYKGRTVTYIVATAAGGGYDGYGRLTARHLEKKLPGSTFVVVNRPGAGHIIGTNLIYTAKPDGQTIGTFNTGVIYSQILKRKSVRYDLAKMSWIGKAAAESRTIMVSATTPFMNFLDFQKAKEPVKMAISGIGSSAYMELQLLAKVFEANFKLLPGYSGNDDEMAMMRGEVVGKMGSTGGQGAFVRSGRGRFVLRIGGEWPSDLTPAMRGEDIAKTNLQKAVVTLIGSQADMFRVTAGPPNIRKDRLDALRAAYDAAFKDPQLLAEAKKLNWDISPLVGDPVGKAISAALEQPPEIVAMMREVQNAKPSDIKVETALTDVQNGGREIHFKDEGGKATKAKISGSRTRIEVAGKESKRSALKAGMACSVTYKGAGTEASLVACK